MRIINVGILPPPYGGVAVHMNRLTKFIEKKGVDSLIIDISKQKKEKKNCINMSELRMFFHLFFMKEKAVVHFHIFSPKLVVLFFLISFRHNTILTFHNERFLTKLESNGEIIFNILKLLINRLDIFIVLNRRCQQLAEQFIKDRQKIKVISNYIRINKIEKIGDKRILSLREKHKYLLSSNAWDLQFHNGEDLYGIDILIEMMKTLVTKYDVVLIFLLPRISNKNYYKQMKTKIKEYNLQENFIFVTEAQNGPGLWEISDLVIRATNTDGNSISVMEAIDVGTPVLASDCVERPQGVELFKTRDAEDLTFKVIQMIDRISEHHNQCNSSLPDVGEEILNIYNNFK